MRRKELTSKNSLTRSSSWSSWSSLSWPSSLWPSSSLISACMNKSTWEDVLLCMIYEWRHHRWQCGRQIPVKYLYLYMDSVLSHLVLIWDQGSTWCMRWFFNADPMPTKNIIIIMNWDKSECWLDSRSWMISILLASMRDTQNFIRLLWMQHLTFKIRRHIWNWSSLQYAIGVIHKACVSGKIAHVQGSSFLPILKFAGLACRRQFSSVFQISNTVAS